MNNLYVYNAQCLDSEEVQKQYAIVFFHHIQFDFDDFTKSLDNYFEVNPLPEKVILIIPDYLKGDFEEIIKKRHIDLTYVIPTSFDRKSIFKFVQPFYYDIDGMLTASELIEGKIDRAMLTQAFNNALVDIFKKHDGLIKSENAHHFVFPSGKHCDYFLRPGNILLKGNEILFIAFNLLGRLKTTDTIIYCDTSSINSIAFALIELKRRFSTNQYAPPYVESFGSYSAFENNDFTFLKNSFFLVSSSTSSRIIDRLLDKKVDLEQIALIFCMGRKSAYKNNIICNLIYDELHNPNGIKEFKSYEDASLCVLCKNGSIPIEVTGDVFQIEKPKLNLIELKITDAPKFHQEFIRSFYNRTSHSFSFIKSHHYENYGKGELVQPSFEIFLDISGLMQNIDKFKAFKEKIDNYIVQYIPSKTKFLIHLPDKASQLIAQYIKKSISRLPQDDEVILINQTELFTNDTLRVYKENAVAVVISSSLVSGSRLLYISREMRDYSNLSLVYFIGFSRPEDETYLTFIKNNLTMGKYGLNTNSFLEIERVYTPNERQNTVWIVEAQFLINLKNLCENVDEEFYKEAIDYFNDRITKLDEGYKSNGMSDGLFYPNILLNKELRINKNFAFYKFQGYRDNASQSDVYFTIAIILNSLRNSNDLNRKIANSHFVRTLLEPNNFNRYNDGIIQAALMRAAHSKELNYDLDRKLSSSMLNIIFGIIEFSDQDHGEALLEFLYAIAIRKMRLKDYHLGEILDKLKGNEKCANNKVIMAFALYIKKVIFEKNKEFIDEYSLKLDFE
jgi:hypothetical protein